MLFSQLPGTFSNNIAGDVKVNLGVFSATIKKDKDTSSPDIVKKLEAVLEYLKKEGTTRELDDPNLSNTNYVHAILELKFSEIEGVVYFGGDFGNKLVGMVGSLGSLIGNQELSQFSQSNLLFADNFLKRVLEGNIRLIEETDNDRYIQIIKLANSTLDSTSQKLEFLSKTHYSSKDVYFGTPIYVSLV